MKPGHGEWGGDGRAARERGHAEHDAEHDAVEAPHDAGGEAGDEPGARQASSGAREVPARALPRVGDDGQVPRLSSRHGAAPLPVRQRVSR